MHNTMKYSIKRITVIFTLMVAVISTTAQEKYPVEVGGLLLDGYDPVSFFDHAPVKGKEDITATFDGRIIRFASTINRDRFLREKYKYMPAYGGWCAISMVKKNLVLPDYTMYKIQDDQLHFFAVKGFFNGQTAWEKDPILHKVIADVNYDRLFHK